MVSFARTISGLLYQSDGTLTGWSGSGWTSSAIPRLVCFGPLPVPLLPTAPITPLDLAAGGSRGPALCRERRVVSPV